MPASPTHGAPGRGHALGEGGAAPPLDPDDPNNTGGGDDASGEEGAALEAARAEPWEPDANLMRALGLELEELRARVEAGEPDRSDDPRRPTRAHPDAGGAPGALSAATADPAEPTPASEERPPWW